ncbi:hypothetical protein BDN71DRAFT_1513160 [Pleurotus eryngii]|uniref:Uncharacterized protein n=1 Tax=Pleurotus eryngii TaxID=5323 RepID=A0A9P6DA55_PLEER|nr:hypothetical protein BDN71DRAFT_1513160 [Pleurotus eryngii]
MASKHRSSCSKPSRPAPNQPKGSRRLRRAQLLAGGTHKKEGDVEVVMTSDEDVTSAASHDDSDAGTSLLVSTVQFLGQPTPLQPIGWSPEHINRGTDTRDIIPFGSPDHEAVTVIGLPTSPSSLSMMHPTSTFVYSEDESGTEHKHCGWNGDSDDGRQAGFLASYQAQLDGQSMSETTSETEYESPREFYGLYDHSASETASETESNFPGEFWARYDQSDDEWGEVREWSLGLIESYEAQWLDDESEWDAMLITSYEAQWDQEEHSERDVFASSLVSNEELWDGLSDVEYEFTSSLSSYKELWDGFSDVEYEFPVQLWGSDDQREWDSGLHESNPRSAYYGDNESASRDMEERGDAGNAVRERIETDDEYNMQTVAAILTSVAALDNL